MGRQKKNLHPKGMEDFPLKELNEMEVSKLSDIEFKIMVIKMYKDTDNYKELCENYISMKKEIETMNKNQEEMKDTISEIKNTLEGITNWLDEAEYRISELEDKVKRNTQIEQLHKNRLKKYEDNLRELRDNMKLNNIQIIGIPEGEENEQGIENLFKKIMTRNFPNLERKKTCKFRKHKDEPKEASSKTYHN